MLADGASARPRADFHATILRMQGAISAVADCRTPTIASVHGWCIGGGVDLISAVDIRYASADAKFSVREVKLAMVADVGSLARLPLILTDGHLRELALTGKNIDAARAEKIGLVNDVYDDAEASLAAAHETAAEIAANPPLTISGIKDVLDQQRIARVSESLRYVAAWNSAMLPSKDLTEGITATFEKRTPNFTGEVGVQPSSALALALDSGSQVVPNAVAGYEATRPTSRCEIGMGRGRCSFDESSRT